MEKSAKIWWVNKKFAFTDAFTVFVYLQSIEYQHFILYVNEVNDKYIESR